MSLTLSMSTECWPIQPRDRQSTCRDIKKERRVLRQSTNPHLARLFTSKKVPINKTPVFSQNSYLDVERRGGSHFTRVSPAWNRHCARFQPLLTSPPKRSRSRTHSMLARQGIARKLWMSTLEEFYTHPNMWVLESYVRFRIVVG